MRYGYFDNEHREYVITRPDATASWTNYLGVKDLCTVLSQNAGGYSFYQSAGRHRITRFRSNGVPLDRPGHYVYFARRSDARVLVRLLAACGQGPRPLRVLPRSFV